MFQENFKSFSLKKHSSKILVGLLVLSFSLFWMEKKWHAKKLDTKKTIFLADQLLSAKEQMISKESFEKIADLLKKKPYLKPKYQAAFRLALLSQHQEKQALACMKEQLHASLPDEILQFNQISYLVTEKKIEEAFALALEYEQSFANAEFPSLRLQHLLRLFFLANDQNDLLCKQVTFEKMLAHPLWPEVELIFTEGDLSTKDFL